MTSEWLQIRHKTQVSDTFEVGKLYFKIDGYLPDFRDSVIFPYISLYTQAVAYTTYVQSAARRALKNQKHIKKTTFELGKPVVWSLALCKDILCNYRTTSIVSTHIANCWSKTSHNNRKYQL